MSIVYCTTPVCVGRLRKYGPNYHKVEELREGNQPPFMPDATHRCEFCGGYTNGKEWKHICHSCGTEVAPGELTGMFVPHLCRECEQEAADDQIRRGSVCTLCRKPYCRCAC